MKTGYQPKYFDVQQLAEGVYAALAIGGTGARCNAGIVDLGGQTLVFDTFFTPQAAQALRRYAEQITGQPVTWVVNSHRHADHVLGNQVFADAQIVATDNTRERIAQRTSGFVAQAKADTTSLAALAAQIDAEPNARVREQMTLSLGDHRALEHALPTLELTLPTMTFEDRVVLHGTQRHAEVHCYGGGHSASDAFLLLPDDQILFAGDIVQVRTHPWLGGGTPEGWDRILEQLAMLDIEQIVPGHGPLGSRADLALMRQYIHDLQQLAAQAVTRGDSAAQVGATDVLAAYADWASPRIWTTNMQFLHERLLKARL